MFSHNDVLISHYSYYLSLDTEHILTLRLNLFFFGISLNKKDQEKSKENSICFLSNNHLFVSKTTKVQRSTSFQEKDGELDHHWNPLKDLLILRSMLSLHILQLTRHVHLLTTVAMKHFQSKICIWKVLPENVCKMHFAQYFYTLYD